MAEEREGGEESPLRQELCLEERKGHPQAGIPAVHSSQEAVVTVQQLSIYFSKKSC